jgi:hypothetical protein
VRDDPERATGGGHEARPRAARKTRRERVHDTGARSGDDDQRGEQELDAQAGLLRSRTPVTWFMVFVDLSRLWRA